MPTKKSSPIDLRQRLVPQIGAILYLDTELADQDAPSLDPLKKRPNLVCGNRHWKLAGSCVLIGCDRVLTIRHLLDKEATGAVFLPYEGLFLVRHVEVARKKNRYVLEWVSPGEAAPGDYLGLVTIDGTCRRTTPLPWAYTSISPNEVQRKWKLFVGGYGGWEKPGPAARRTIGGGIQRVWGPLYEGKPPQGAFSEPWSGYDQLDLKWSSAYNHRLAAGRGNSGGAMMARDGKALTLVGINREERDDEQVGARMGGDRVRLLEQLPGETRHAPEAHLPTVDEVRTVDVPAGGGVGPIELKVPRGMTAVQSTLSATDGLHLQMAVSTEAAEVADSRLQDDPNCAGRFLFRRLSLDDDAETVYLGVAHLVRSRPRADSVTAQICVRFSGSADQGPPAGRQVEA